MWEYLVTTTEYKGQGLHLANFQRELNEYGKEGWELVAMTGHPAILVFKRQPELFNG